MKKNSISTIILVLILVAGLSLLLYPSFSNYWNDKHQTKAIADYEAVVQNLKTEDFSQFWNSAREFNTLIQQRRNVYALEKDEATRYWQELNVAGDGIMGQIQIPSIQVRLPLYHGTDDAVLQVAVGHLEWTSLPTGGAGTHSVFSGHRGLPSARLFSDLDKMQVGDVFMLQVLDETLTYEVDQIQIVLPQEVEGLRIVEGRDLCTLVTCTPYGINSHRLLVRGTRIANIAEEKVARVTADAVRVEPVLVAPVLAIPIFLLMLLVLCIPKPKKNRRKKRD